jgi:predicted enzyme related to lactoylglutathione lyase
MNQNIVHIALVVDDYDEAIKFYTEKLNFTKNRSHCLWQWRDKRFYRLSN